MLLLLLLFVFVVFFVFLFCFEGVSFIKDPLYIKDRSHCFQSGYLLLVDCVPLRVWNNTKYCFYFVLCDEQSDSRKLSTRNPCNHYNRQVLSVKQIRRKRIRRERTPTSLWKSKQRVEVNAVISNIRSGRCSDASSVRTFPRTELTRSK